MMTLDFRVTKLLEKTGVTTETTLRYVTRLRWRLCNVYRLMLKLAKSFGAMALNEVLFDSIT